MIVNFAERAHNHNWKLGSRHPILLDNGFLQAPDVASSSGSTTRKLECRSRCSIGPLRYVWTTMFTTEEITEQLEHVRKLRFRKSDWSGWLQYVLWTARNF